MPAGAAAAPGTIMIEASATPPYPPAPEQCPPGTIEAGAYRARFAADARDLDRAQELRYRVFNLELAEGLETSHTTQRDADLFDPQCHHLIVEHKPSGEVIGTYRMQTDAMARAARGYYTDAEFDLARLPTGVLANGIELGRACIARPHRGRQALFLLWRGLAAYVVHNRKRFFFGCCSLTSQDSALGWATLAHLTGRDGVWQEIAVPTRPAFACVPPSGPRLPSAAVELPPLFEIYLRYGGKVCSPPALDREFRTIDFLLLFDIARLDEKARRMFFAGA